MTIKSQTQNGIVSKAYEYKIILTTGLALFAMFFGAGNIVFPLFLGANAGQHIGVTALGFLLTGVGVPFLGLIAASLYQGNYHEFFGRLGKIPGFLFISFLMIIIGPLVAMPRTEATTFYALQGYLNNSLGNNAIFSLLYCGLVYLLAYRETKIVEILGLFLSPIKILAFSSLILLGFLYAEPFMPNATTAADAFHTALTNGYNTMDLLAACFFCSVAFKSIEKETQNNTALNPTTLTLKSCILGAVLTGGVYLGFMWIAHHHSAALQGLPEEAMITAVSTAILGKFGGLFVCITVSVACIATALALADVSSNYLHEEVFHHKVSYRQCLTLVMVITYLMSNLGFQGILTVSVPILGVVYPALIALCVLNILFKWKGIKTVKLPVFLIILIFLALP
jgi:LIVCS family branched-chain amino acid:cation transporter